MFTMAPPPALIISGTTKRVQRYELVRQESMVYRQSSIRQSCTGLVGPPSPALFTRVSILPNSFTPVATRRRTSSSWAASHTTARARPPAAVTLAAVSFTRSAERAAHTTAAPSRPKRRLSARPMPLEAPVMMATLPSSRPMSVSVLSRPGVPVALAVGHRRLDVLFEEIPGVDQLLRGPSNARQVVRARGVALGDGRARIARRLSLGSGTGKGQRASREVKNLVHAAALGMPQVPARVSGEGNRQLRYGDARALVAVGIHRADPVAQRAPRLRRERGEVLALRPHGVAWIGGGRNTREGLLELARIHGRAVGEAGMAAGRRRRALRHPPIKIDEGGAEEPAVVHHAAQVVRALPPAPRVGSHSGGIGGRPDPVPVLGAPPVVHAHVEPVLDIARARGIGVDQRRVAAVILEARVRVKRLEPSARLDLERLEAIHHLRPVLGVLPEPLVELSQHGSRHVGDDAVERATATLVHVQIVMDHGAQEAARLRAAIGVGVAERPRRGIALGRAPVLEPGDAIAQRGHAEAEHAGAHSRVGELIDASLLEAALEIHVAG